MLEAFEHWFGPYPFYQDGYKLVEVPYPGMEHQSSVTYGNKYKNGFGGFDLSRSGWGLKFDFIIVHESAHEWFGNNITYKDIADMWIHESFAAYAECLFMEYWFGKQAGYEYVKGTRAIILNKKPVIGIYNVNYRSPDEDMYYKGANMLHTLRQIVEDDKKWNSILKGLNRDFYHQTVATDQIEKYLSDSLCFDLKPFFNQYLRNTKIPVFEYSVNDSLFEYRWENCVSGFDFPLKIKLNGREKWISPTPKRKEMVIDKGAKIEVDQNFYIISKEVRKEN
jgi:aminopeptidase N